MQHIPILKYMTSKQRRLYKNHPDPARKDKVLGWRKIISENKITTQKIAENIGHSAPRVSEWLHFTRVPSQVVCDKIDRYLRKFRG